VTPTRMYSARELLRRAEEPGPFHNFPETFNDDIFLNGNRRIISNSYVEYSLPGEVVLPGKPVFAQESIPFSTIKSTNGQSSIVNANESTIIGYTPSKTVQGVFEIGVEPSATGRVEVIQHRFFRPDE